jgi:hypothetical protein
LRNCPFSEVETKFITEKLARDRRGLLTLQLRKPHSEEFGDQLEEDHQQSETQNNKRISWDGKVGKQENAAKINELIKTKTNLLKNFFLK